MIMDLCFFCTVRTVSDLNRSSMLAGLVSNHRLSPSRSDKAANMNLVVDQDANPKFDLKIENKNYKCTITFSILR